MIDRIKKLCKSRNISVSELERILGFGTGLIFKWESSSPSIEKVAKVADYFDVSLDWLYGRTDYNHLLDNIKDIPGSILFDLSNEEYSELIKYIDYIKYKRSL